MLVGAKEILQERSPRPTREPQSPPCVNGGLFGAKCAGRVSPMDVGALIYAWLESSYVTVERRLQQHPLSSLSWKLFSELLLFLLFLCVLLFLLSIIIVIIITQIQDVGIGSCLLSSGIVTSTKSKSAEIIECRRRRKERGGIERFWSHQSGDIR